MFLFQAKVHNVITIAYCYSFPFSHNIAPKGVIRLISDAPNPILSGSSLTLSCILELNHAIDNVTMVINGPNKVLFPSVTSPVRKASAGLRHMLLITLETPDSADSVDYNCMANISEFVHQTSSNTNILIGMGAMLTALLNLSMLVNLQLMECFSCD